MVDCGDAPGISNGEVTFSSTSFGSTATYSCDAGYELVGEATTTCESSGQWIGTVPVCRLIPTTTMPPRTTTSPTPSGMLVVIYSLVICQCDDIAMVVNKMFVSRQQAMV